MNKRRVLVTGGAGFIGSNLVKALVEEGNSVTVLDNFTSGYTDNLKSLNNVRIINGDIRNADIVAESMLGAEVVFHLAASVGNKRSIEHPFVDSEINVLGTLQILESAKEMKIKKIVVSSSAGIFGELKILPIKEDHPVEPDSPYGCSKLCEEKLCLAYSKLYDIETICLRYFNVYGPNQRYDAYGNVIPIFVYRTLNGLPIQIFGDGEQTRDFVHVFDVVQANLKAANVNGISGAFNIASGTYISINALANLVFQTANKKINIEYLTERPGDVKHSLADIGKARSILNFAPNVDLTEGMRGYMEWAVNELV